jgi:hypothetical protein
MDGRFNMTLKNEYFDEINEAQNEDYGQFEEYCQANPQPKVERTLESTLAFASEYMKTEKFAKEWQTFKNKGEF